jgi:hypothetical protein
MHATICTISLKIKEIGDLLFTLMQITDLSANFYSVMCWSKL